MRSRSGTPGIGPEQELQLKLWQIKRTPASLLVSFLFVLLDMFSGNALALGKEQQVVLAARFWVGTAHVEAAKGLHAHQRPGTFAVEVQVADVEFPLGPFQPFGVAAEERPGQAVLGP